MLLKALIKTYGCQMNEHDTERIIGLLKQSGYRLTENEKEADLIILNTCSIREKAEQKVYSELGRYAPLKQENPHLIIGVAGCVAQQEGERLLKRSSLIDLTFGSAQIDQLPELLVAVCEEGKRVACTEEVTGPVRYTEDAVRKDKIRAWVSIMEGCDKFCSFCVVPFTRGRERNRAHGEILNEIGELGATGYKEVTLLGQTVNSYRSPGGDQDFSDLLVLINDVPGIERVRFISPHPIDVTDRLIRAMAVLPKVCEHIHLPLQSGSDRVLKLMRRGYTYQDYCEKVAALREAIPHISITTDIIVGSPGETEEDFSLTIRAIEDIRFDSVFAFRYSRRPNTHALEMDGHLPEEVKTERLQRVLALAGEIMARKNQDYLGKVVEVLVEGRSKTRPDRWTGRTRTNRVVNFQEQSLAGCLLPVRIIEARPASLVGEVSHS